MVCPIGVGIEKSSTSEMELRFSSLRRTRISYSSPSSFKKPTAVEEGFVCEILDETDDGYANVVHWYSDPSNGSGTKSNAPGATYVYISDVPSYVDTTAYDYLEFTYNL